MKLLDVAFVGSARLPADLPRPAFPEIAFAGRSNAGKSSLINSLLNRRNLARVSRTPGCTRGINLFRATWSGVTAYLADLPGYGYARRSKAEMSSWQPLVESFLGSRPDLRAVVVLVDVRRGVQDEERQLLQLLARAEVSSILVATKLDKVAASKRKTTLAALQKRAGSRVIGFSAVSGEGREQLLRAVWRALIPPDAWPSREP
jgi:GTP-binding protein